MSRFIKIYYGPYEAFHTISHKPQKLKGLKDELLKLGYRVVLVPVEHRDMCVLSMCGYEIFRCNIKNLSFNTNHENDRTCQLAVAAAEEATIKFTRAKTYLWLWNYIEEQIFQNGPLFLQADWPFELDHKRLGSVADCVKCCGILTTSNDH